MKMKKGKLLQRITAFLLSTLLIVEMLQSAAPITVLAMSMDIASGTDWVLDVDGHLTIRSDEGMLDWQTNGKSQNNSKVETVEVLDGVTSIIAKAFTSGSLTSVIIPSSVTSIDADAFRSCSSLETVTFADAENAKIESFGAFAFGDCRSLKSIIIPDSVTSIGESSFYGSGLESVEIPDSVIEIQNGGFSYCRNLATITWPDNDLITIGDYAFRNDEQLKEISIPSNVTEIPLSMFSKCTELTKVTIPSGVTSIGDDAFFGCGNLMEVTIEATVPPTLIRGGEAIFNNCGFVVNKTGGIKVPPGSGDAYKAAWIPWVNYIVEGDIASGTDWVIDADGKLTIMSDAGMQDWHNQKSDMHVKVKSAEIKDGVTTIAGSDDTRNGAFSECSNLTSITLPDSITSIGKYAFFKCGNLTSIFLPDSITSIGEYAFYECGSLTYISIPSKVRYIADYAFGYCSSLRNVWMPDNIMGISQSAFQYCTSLRSITIPSGVTSIEENAFSNCSSLETVDMQSNTPPTIDSNLGYTVFYNCKFVTEDSKGILVPYGTAKAYKEAWTDWADYITDGTEEDNIASGKGWTLSADGKLTIESDTGMENWRIGNYSLREKVKSAEIKDGVTTIAGSEDTGNGAFSECSNLTSITLPDSITSIEAYAFYQCTSLEAITIPDKVKKIGAFAFCRCSSLKNIIIPDGMTRIDRYTFDGCTGLESITIPDSVMILDEGAFWGCSGLTAITLPNKLEGINRGAFFGCVKLTSITIPRSVSSIEGLAFKRCTSLESVIMVGNAPPTLHPTAEEGAMDHFLECKFVTENIKGIQVPYGRAFAYKEAWTEWADYITDSNKPTEDEDKVKVEAAKKAVTDALATIQVSNTTTRESLEAAVKEALKKAGIDGSVTVTIEDFDKTDATTDASGSISANIKITSGGESASVPVNKIIDRLPGTPAEKVALAKAAVENAVNKVIETTVGSTKVTNDNAEEIAAQIAALLPDVITKALEEAGISAADIEIGEVDIKIEPATADSEGSIKVTIPVTSKEDPEQSKNAEVSIVIAKPGEESDPDKDAQEAQKIVEDVLKNLTITNETTPEDILAALKEAFGDKAAVEGIEEFVKEDATEDAPGSLKLKIKLLINGNTVYVVVNVPIAQLIKRTGMYVRFIDYYDMIDSTPRYKYTGMAIKPAVEVYNNETLLIPGKDYTIGYKNNTKVGSTAALTVKGKGNFSGTSNVVNFTIIGADIDQDTDHPTEMTVIVNTKVAPVIMNGTKKLTTKDYKLEGEGLVNSKYTAATAAGIPNTLTVKGIGSYEGSSFEIKVTVIEKSAAKKLTVTLDKNFKPVYDGSTLNLSSLFKSADNEAGAITVTDSKDKNRILKEGTDFTVVCTSSLSNAGTVKFTVTGMGEYTGSVSKTFKIAPLKVTDSSKFSVTFDEDKAYEYKADGVTVDNLVVKYLGATDSNTDDQVLIQNVDYKVTYSNNKKVSGTKEAGLKITFLGNYKGSSAVSKTFKVVTAKLSEVNTAVTVPDKVYNKANQAYKSTPIVTVDGATIKASNYTVSYAWATESQAGDDTKYVSDNKVKITIADGDTYAKVKVTIALKANGSYGLAEGAVIAGEYYVRRAGEAVNLSKAKVTFFNKAGTQLKSLEYNGKTFYTPAGNNPEAVNAPADPNAVYVKVTVGGAVVDPSLYDVTWTNAKAKGKATVVIRGKGIASEKGIAVGSKNQAVSIKAMALKGKTLPSYMWNAVSNWKKLFIK